MYIQISQFSSCLHLQFIRTMAHGLWHMEDIEILMSVASEIQKDVAQIPRLLQEIEDITPVDAEIESGQLFIMAQEIIHIGVFLNTAAARNMIRGCLQGQATGISHGLESFPPFEFSTQMKEIMGFNPGESQVIEFQESQDPTQVCFDPYSICLLIAFQ